MVALIARALVHLNFDEAHEAQKVLCEALTEINFPAANSKKETVYVRTAAA